MALELVRMTSAQLLALPRAKTVFFFPVGPIEDHGPHLPLGMDLNEALALSRMMGERLERDMPGWTAVLMPAAPLGLDSNTQGLALRVRAHVLRDWLVDGCKGLMRAGYCNFVCFSGHLGPRQLTAIEEAGALVYKSTRWIRFSRRIFGRGAVTKDGRDPLPFLISASSSQVTPGLVRRSPLFLDTAEHGGRRDTSVALAMDAGAVEASYGSLAERAWVDPSHWSRAMKRVRGQVSGYWGKPAEGSVGWGQSVLSGSIDEIFPKLKAVLEGADPNLLFRSWYSVIPLNRTFFKSWLLALSFCFLLMMWIFMNMQALLSGS
jgi:creatinine amidohydrolase/Fe(II)-dependent formamide hydrolase-like protein